MIKKYLKPEMEIQAIISNKNISALGEWLEQNNVSEDVSIVEYSFAIES